MRDKPDYSMMYFIKEAFISAVKPEPIDMLPSKMAYQWRPQRSLSKYIVLAGVMISLSISLMFGDMWLGYIGLTISSFTIPIAFLYWFVQNDRYDPEPTTLIIYLFGWGTIAGLLSYFLNPLLFPFLGAGGGAFIEEPLKLVGVFLLGREKLLKSEINSHLDGMIYGAAVGAGFASLETLLYLFNTGGGSTIPYTMLSRSTTAFCHIAWTAIAARTLGLANAVRGRMAITDLIPGLLIVIPLHYFWNSFAEMMRGWFILPITLLILFREVNMAVDDEIRWGFKLVAPNEKKVRRTRLRQPRRP